MRGAAVRLPPPAVRGLDDPLFVPREEVVDADPGAGVLPDALDGAPGFADHAGDLGIGAEDAEECCHGVG